MKWLASFALLAIQLQLLFSRGVQGFQTTCGQEYNYTAVPSTIKDDPSYNARDPKINWKGYMNAIDCLGRREGSFCPFITRMVFHDSGAVDEATPTGSDGSLFTSSLEGISPANTQYGEAPTLRYMLQKLIEKFGISWADGLGVAALVCTNTLGSDVKVQQVCSSKDTPFYVGKLDGSPAFANIAFDLPFPATSFDAFVSFWTTTLSGFAKEDKWKFSLEDAAALMGSHILNVPHGCTRGAYFRQRNRNFDNGYFKDLLSGTVTVALDNKTICDNKQPCVGTPDQGESAGCKFSDSNIERRNEVARVQVADAQKANGFGTFTPSPFPAVNWKPDYRSRGPCYGQQCICCAPWDVKPGSRRPFCIGRMVGECMWPYTINDGFMAQGVKSAAPAVGKDDLLAAYTKFRDDLRGFREAYAVGLCKLAHVAPRFGSAEAVDLYELVGDHVGKCWELGYDPRLVWGVFGPPQCRVPEDKVIRKRRPFEFFFHH